MGKFNGRRKSVPYMSELSLKTVRGTGFEMRCRWGVGGGGAMGEGGGRPVVLLVHVKLLVGFSDDEVRCKEKKRKKPSCRGE